MSGMTGIRKQCSEPGCVRVGHSRGWCKTHWQQKRRAGVFDVDPEWRKLPKGERTYLGPGESITSNGYRRIRFGPNDWRLEHRAVMEAALGRPLLENENVHHKNGDKLDNALSNLELWVTHQPVGLRVEDAVAWAHEILARYGHLEVEA